MQLIAVLLLIGGGLGVVAAMEASAREALCAARGEWFGPLAAGLSEPKRRQQFEADPHLRRVAEGVAEVERAGVECRGGRFHPLGFLDFTKTRAALASLQQVERDLAPETWPRLQKLRGLVNTFERRGWQQPAGYVAQLIEGVRHRPAVSTALSRPSVLLAPTNETGNPEERGPGSPAGGLAVRIERLLRLQPIIEAGAASSEAEWQTLDQRAAELERSDDPIVRGFGAVLRRESAAAVRLGDEGFEGLPSLAEHAQLAGQILAALREQPADQVDARRFTAEVLLDPAQLELADVQVWLQKRPLYVVRQREIQEQAAKLRQQFVDTRTKVNDSGPDPAELQAYKLEQENVEVALRQFSETPFIEQDIARGDFDKRVKQVVAQIQGLDKYYHAENADDWLQNLAPVQTASDRLKNFWEAYVRNLQSEKSLMAERRDVFAENKARTDTLRNVLTELDLLPHPPQGLSPAFEAAARQHREDRLKALLEGLNSAAPQLKPGVMDAERAAMTQWFDNLQALAADFPIGNRLLTIDERPDEKWETKDPAFWKDPLVRTLVKGDVDRIQRLQKLREAPRDVLAREAVAEAVRPEVRLAAWQQLGQPRVTPLWPATVDELKTEGTLRGLVLDDAKSLGEFERETLADEVRKEGPRRWRRFVEGITPEEARKPVEANPLGTALSLASAFNVDPVALQEISPPARFNVWLYFAHEASRERFNDKRVEAVVRDLRLAAKNLKDEERATAVLAKLEKMDEPEPFAGPESGEKVFRVAVAGVEAPIEFLRVEPKGGRPFYLGTREVTLGQFAGALAGKQLWTEALRLQWAYQPDRNNATDRRRGPRVWEWRDPNAPRLEPAALWLTPDDVNDFPSEFHPLRKFNRNVIDPRFGGMPSEQHPMQYVSAQAALYYAAALGFRLPTSTEWRAALAASGKTVASGDWNLRDQSWEAFRAHAAKNRIAPDRWPDRGAFPESPTAARRATAQGPTHSGNDSTLLFRPVPETDGVFHDLIGNVAEYVCEAPNAFASWPNNGTAEGVKNFLVDTPDSVAVIGGSALSPRDVPLDRPLPVKETHWGFSDVGLRLAFTAPARNKAERLKWVLAGEEYMDPARTVSADTSR